MNEWWIDSGSNKYARTLGELTAGLTPHFAELVRDRAIRVREVLSESPTSRLPNENWVGKEIRQVIHLMRQARKRLPEVKEYLTAEGLLADAITRATDIECHVGANRESHTSRLRNEALLLGKADCYLDRITPFLSPDRKSSGEFIAGLRAGYADGYRDANRESPTEASTKVEVGEFPERSAWEFANAIQSARDHMLTNLVVDGARWGWTEACQRHLVVNFIAGSSQRQSAESQTNLILPSDSERSEWKDATEAYVYGLEVRLAELETQGKKDVEQLAAMCNEVVTLRGRVAGLTYQLEELDR